MRVRHKTIVGGFLGGLALLALTAGPLSAQAPAETPTAPSRPMSGPAVSHEQMDQMMGAMHGEGASRRMHEAMGEGDAERGEQLMQQCVNMMGMMQGTSGMMGSGASGMMGR